MTPLKSDRPPTLFAPPRRECIRVRERACLPRFTRVFRGSWRTAAGLMLFAAIFLGVQMGPARAQTDTATYTVTFRGNWNTDSTPGGVAGGAHFTTLIGAVHNSGVTFWAAGGTASAGVEGVAETGATSTFETEIGNAATGTVKSAVRESGTSATGARTFEVEFSRTHPLLTLLSMIGPSPDWFVGVSGLSMLDGPNWRSSLTRDLFPYDAGTEDGEEFSLNNDPTSPRGTITSLKGQGRFSDTRMARLSFTLKERQSNNAPMFPSTGTMRSFAETVGMARVQSVGNVGAAVTAMDDDNDTLTYSLEGTDGNKFTIVSGSGQIRTRVGESYDREARASYSVTVKADDGNGGMDTIAVTVDVTNESEPPLAPAAPSVSSAGATSLNVRWNRPANAGRPGITGYEVQYRQGRSGGWTDIPRGDISGTSATIAVSDSGAQHQARVLATNSDGDGPWSEPGSNVTGRPVSPPPPPPAMEAADVDTDDELRGFVEDAAERIEASDTFEETLRLFEEFRDSEGDWNDGSMYLVLLTKGGGVYFHANDREVEDLDWSGVLFCEGGGSALDRQDGCFIEYDGERSGYAHPFFASHVPLARGEEEFILLGGFDGTPEGETFAGEIEGPSTKAGEVDTDEELREFVGEGGRTLMAAILNPEVDPAQLRGILRREGPWREGDVHVYIMDETGRVIFDGADRSREQKDESAKQYVRDLIAEAGEGIVEYREGGLLRRGYAVRVEVFLDEEGEDSHVYVVGSGYRAEERPGGSGGGCAVGESDGGTFGLFLVALALLFTVSLGSAGGFAGSWQILTSAENPHSLPERNKRSGFCGGYSPRDV